MTRGDLDGKKGELPFLNLPVGLGICKSGCFEEAPLEPIAPSGISVAGRGLVAAYLPY
jgi:hypothetical protein